MISIKLMLHITCLRIFCPAPQFDHHLMLVTVIRQRDQITVQGMAIQRDTVVAGVVPHRYQVTAAALLIRHRDFRPQRRQFAVDGDSIAMACNAQQ